MDEQGAASALAFIVAGALFLAAVAVLLMTVEDKVPSAQDVNTGYRAHAESVLALLVESPGIGWNQTSSNWTAGAYRPSLVEEVRVLNNTRLATWTACPATRCLPFSDVQTRLGLGILSFNVTITDTSGAVLLWYGPASPVESAQQASDAATVPVRRDASSVDYTVTVRVFAP